MMVDRIGSITPLTNVQNTKKTNATNNVASGVDTISISAEAKERADEIFLSKIAQETPDVREDVVASLKAKLSDPNYITPQVVSDTAQKIMEAYGV